MIDWMSDRTNAVLDYYNVGVIGFDPEKSSGWATCQVTYDGVSAVVLLGNVSGLDDRAVDRRFAAAMHRLATEIDEDPTADFGQVRKLYDIADTLLGVKELPPKDAAPKLKWYKFSMRMEADHSIAARSLDEAEDKAREWMEDIRVIKMTDGTNDDYIDMDEFVAQPPELLNICEV